MPNPLEIMARLAEYLKGKPYWSQIEPLFTLVSLYITTGILAYEYIQWAYHVAPPLSLYLNSYIFNQITVVFAAIGLAGAVVDEPGGHRVIDRVAHARRGGGVAGNVVGVVA